MIVNRFKEKYQAQLEEALEKQYSWVKTISLLLPSRLPARLAADVNLSPHNYSRKKPPETPNALLSPTD